MVAQSWFIVVHGDPEDAAPPGASSVTDSGPLGVDGGVDGDAADGEPAWSRLRPPVSRPPVARSVPERKPRYTRLTADNLEVVIRIPHGIPFGCPTPITPSCVCVDWCDAKAFCEARGHRLCSRIGGGVLPYEFAGQADISQWSNACSSGGVFDFVYGREFKEGACNTFVDDIPKTVPVGSYPGCQSAVPGHEGVFDLLGNAGEWGQASLFDPADCAAAAPPIFSTHDPPPPIGAATPRKRTVTRATSSWAFDAAPTLDP